MNFDGKTDFRLMEFLPAGPNVPFLYWIYNPTSELFEKNKTYEDITSPEFDNENKLIQLGEMVVANTEEMFMN